MQKRSLAAVFFLTLLTFGIYGIVWYVKTKGEMNQKGASIPTAWLIIVPFVSIWWMWKYCEGVEHVTGGKLSTVTSFLVLFLLGVIGMLIVQDSFNKLEGAPVASAPAAQPQNEVTPPAPQPPVTTV